MNLKKGLLAGLGTILFIIIFAEIFGKDSIIYFRYSSLNVKIIVSLFIVILLFIFIRKKYR